jgi:hypothetical protein
MGQFQDEWVFIGVLSAKFDSSPLRRPRIPIWTGIKFSFTGETKAKPHGTASQCDNANISSVFVKLSETF